MNGHAQLAEAMRRHGSSPSHAYSQPRQATISSYDPNTHAVKVLLQPEGVESNWMPLGAIGVGNGWGIVCGPQIGDQVHVSFAEGDFHSGIVVGRVFSTSATPPAAPSGETWMVHSSGSLLKFLNNGDVQLTTARDLLANVGRNLVATVTGNITTSGAAWTHTGAMTLLGSLTVTGGDVTADGYSIKGHKHTGVTTGVGTSGPSTP